MQEPEIPALRGRELSPPGPGFLEQSEGTDDVGLNKFRRPVDRAIDVAFGGEVNDRARGVFLEEPPHQSPVADIAVEEYVRRIAFVAFEVCRIACIGELVQ